jgi:ABC-type Zn uptake system ZnuABC Zn-binding protein ZnuA/ABC-type Mn2+/Zn2+ transport system permease subunit
MTEALIDPFTLPYVQRAAVEILLLAVAAGLIGPWIVLRALAFFSHAVGISTFPGLVLADGIGFSPQVLAFVAAGAFTLLTSALARVRNAATDAITALALVGFLAAGVILASDLFGSAGNVDSLLFGSLLSIGDQDLLFAAGTAAFAVLVSTLLARHWLARGFDEQSAAQFGSGSRLFDIALLATVAVVVIAALNAIGALLVIALLVVPAATVRLITRRVSTLQIGTLALVAVEGTAGIWLSVKTDVPPGATIAVLSGLVFGLVVIGKALRSRAHGRKGLGLAGVAVAGGLFLAGCASDDGASDRSARAVSAIATTTQIADVVREVGGDQVEVTGLLRPNTDPHDYEPRPSDVAAFPDADVVFVNGGDLDDWVEELIDDSGSVARVVDLSTAIPVRLEGGEHDHDHGGEKAEGEGHSGELDAHWWHDPINVVAATQRVSGVLGRLEPSSKAVFARNARRYETELDALDRAIAVCLDQIPARYRKMVTDHEAFGYFANRYGIEVIGTVIPALTTQAEPSAGDLAELERTIRAERVEAVFPESSVPSATAEAIARDTGASADYVLYGDSLGPADSRAGTYIGMMEENADQVARGLSGGEVGCTFE